MVLSVAALRSSATPVPLVVGRAATVPALVACVCLLYSGAASGAPSAGFIIVVIALSAYRPADALIAIAGLSPLITIAMNGLAGAPGDWAEIMILAAAAGWCLRRLALGESLDAAALRTPVMVFAVMVVLSLIVQLAVVRTVVSPEVFRSLIVDALRLYSTDTAGIPGVGHAAFRLLEGLFLLSLILTLRANRDLPVRILRMLVIGASGVAIVNIARIVSGALRSDAPVTALAQLLRTVRLSTPYGDVNAAGSYFALALLTALGAAAVAHAGLRRMAWLSAAALCATALWISGSRAAVIAALLGLVLFAAMRLRGRALTRAVAVVAIASGAVVWFFPNPILDSSAVGALHIRSEMARVSFRMLRSDPVFGVGIGQFRERSAGLIRDASVRAVYEKENAHNNFLQIAAELGLLGAFTFVGLLWITARSAVTTRREFDPVLQGAIAGLTAFLITALLGHPLLTSEVAIAFWVALGAVAGVSLSASGPDHTRSRSYAVAVALAVLVTLTPWRIHRAIASADFEHVGHGVSTWHRDETGHPYRQMLQDATLFIPRDATSVALPYRLEKPGPRVMLELRFRDRLADRIEVVDGDWRVWRFVVTRDASSPRYIPLTVTVLQGRPGDVLLGKLSTTGAQ